MACTRPTLLSGGWDAAVFAWHATAAEGADGSGGPVDGVRPPQHVLGVGSAGKVAIVAMERHGYFLCTHEVALGRKRLAHACVYALQRR